MTAADIAIEQAALRREREAQEAIQRQQEDRDEDGNAIAESSNREQETVYRTAQGQKIDLKAEKAEQKRKEREQREKEAERMEWGKGLVQRREREERTAREREMAQQGVARLVAVGGVPSSIPVPHADRYPITQICRRSTVERRTTTNRALG